MSASGAERAARFDAHLLPQGERARVLDPWREAVRAAGRSPDARRVGIIRSCFVTDDPERDWPAVRAAERYRGALYNRFFAESGQERSWYRAGPRIPQTWVVGDADHCVAELSAFIAAHGITDMVTWAVPPGLRPEQDEPEPGALRPGGRAAAPGAGLRSAAALASGMGAYNWSRSGRRDRKNSRPSVASFQSPGGTCREWARSFLKTSIIRAASPRSSAVMLSSLLRANDRLSMLMLPMLTQRPSITTVFACR